MIQKSIFITRMLLSTFISDFRLYKWYEIWDRPPLVKIWKLFCKSYNYLIYVHRFNFRFEFLLLAQRDCLFQQINIPALGGACLDRSSCMGKVENLVRGHC